MKKEIVSKLKLIEHMENVKILFAVEAGSRVWRLDSSDSDYDVRFVFARSKEDYLSVFQPKDVIEYAYDKEFQHCDIKGSFIDIVGFDILKFARLLSKSNPSMIEWLMSDMVYLGKQPKDVLKHMKDSFDSTALWYHYQSMCKQNYLKYIKSGDLVTYKKYLYSMRGLVNSLWVKGLHSLPPIDFNDGIAGIELPSYISKSLKEMIELKKEGREKEIIQNKVKIDSFIESYLREEFKVERKIFDVAPLNKWIRREI